MRANPVKAKLRRGEVSFGTWLSLGNLFATRVLARMGFDWLTLDIEHQAIDWSQATTIFAAMVDAVEQARRAIAAAKYPPTGNRSLGGGMHSLNFAASSGEYYQRANDEI